MIVVKFNDLKEFMEDVEEHGTAPTGPARLTYTRRRASELPFSYLGLRAGVRRADELVVLELSDYTQEIAGGPPDEKGRARAQEDHQQLEKFFNQLSLNVQGGGFDIS